MQHHINNQFITCDNILYGMTFDGGVNDKGIIFKINTDGSDFRKLFEFSGFKDGAYPSSSLILSNNTLYGTTIYGGQSNEGIIFGINADGSNFRKLFEFNRRDEGASPRGSLVFSGNELYGITSEGGRDGYGTIYKINMDGSGFRKLFDFDNIAERTYSGCSLVLSGAVLYGVRSRAADFTINRVFRINTDGTGFRRLCGPTEENEIVNNIGTTKYKEVSFCRKTGDYRATSMMDKTNTEFQELMESDMMDDEVYPWGSLILFDSTFYGITSDGGEHDRGVIFKVKENGTGFRKLGDFDGIDCGSYPYGSLFIVGTSLYGLTSRGGVNDSGVIFRINLDGTSFRKIHDFEICGIKANTKNYL